MVRNNGANVINKCTWKLIKLLQHKLAPVHTGFQSSRLRQIKITSTNQIITHVHCLQLLEETIMGGKTFSNHFASRISSPTMHSPILTSTLLSLISQVVQFINNFIAFLLHSYMKSEQIYPPVIIGTIMLTLVPKAEATSCFAKGHLIPLFVIPPSCVQCTMQLKSTKEDAIINLQY